VARCGIARTFQNLNFRRSTVLDNVLLGRHSHPHPFVAAALGLPRWKRTGGASTSCREILDFLDLRSTRHRVGDLPMRPAAARRDGVGAGDRSYCCCSMNRRPA
jgi:ABC-type branched-subunit amino acid transport system ATPase component